MHTGKAILFVLSISLCSGAPAASVYKSIDEQGNVIYTDDPAGNARKVDLPPLSTYPAPDLETLSIDRARTDVPPNATGAAGYSSLVITRPEPEGTVRDNTGAVEVHAALESPLDEAAGHRFRFYLDGQAVGEPLPVPRTTIENLDRGAHEVQVAVVDAAGNVLKRSDSVRFYLHQMSRNFPHGPKPPPNPAPPPN